MNPPSALRRLVRRRLQYNVETPPRRLELLRLLEKQTLKSARQVRGLHEILLLVSTLPYVERWPEEDRLSLGKILRAKGGRRESDFVALFDSHRRLQRSLFKLSCRTRGK